MVSHATAPSAACVVVPQAAAPPVLAEKSLSLDALQRLGEARRKVGHRIAAELLVYVIALVEQAAQSPLLAMFGVGSELEMVRPLDRNRVMKTLDITLDEYKGAIKALRGTGLIKWFFPGGRARARVGLSPEGIAWARSVGLLPPAAGSKG